MITPITSNPIQVFVCSRCGGKFATRKEVENDASLRNGEYNIIYPDLCGKCAKEIAQFMLSGEKEPKGLPEVKEV